MFYSRECRMYLFLSEARLVCCGCSWLQYNSAREALPVESDPDWTHSLSTLKPAHVLRFLSQWLAQQPSSYRTGAGPNPQLSPASSSYLTVPSLGPLPSCSSRCCYLGSSTTISCLEDPNSLLLAGFPFPVLSTPNLFLHSATSRLWNVHLLMLKTFH